MKSRRGTLDAPDQPDSVPNNAQWLSGQGAGVWFCIDKTNVPNEYLIQRFTPEGELDCKRIFAIENAKGFDLNQPYQFVHISHCAKCRIVQNNQEFVFHWIEREN